MKQTRSRAAGRNNADAGTGNPVSEYQQTESTLMTILPYLPERDTWPDPLQKMFMLFTIENTVKERTAGMEWTALPDIPTTMQQALVAIEDHDFYRHGAVDMAAYCVQHL